MVGWDTIVGLFSVCWFVREERGLFAGCFVFVVFGRDVGRRFFRFDGGLVCLLRSFLDAFKFRFFRCFFSIFCEGRGDK